MKKTAQLVTRELASREQEILSLRQRLELIRRLERSLKEQTALLAAYKPELANRLFGFGSTGRKTPCSEKQNCRANSKGFGRPVVFPKNSSLRKTENVHTAHQPDST